MVGRARQRYLTAVPFLELAGSPVVPQEARVRLHVRDAGTGPPVVLLHGGWGYQAYPFDAAITALVAGHRVLAPDRAGYGRSDPVDALPPDFHRRMAEETLALLDALGLDSAALWGHSDGAVVAAWTAILRPDRVRALVLEALHYARAKPGSIEFFETGVEAPERFGDAVVEALRRDHGERWREVSARGARAWLEIIRDGIRDGGDLYGGRLGEVRAPTLVLHGRRDPRTEPGELEAALATFRDAPRCELLEAGHAPHASATAGARCVAVAAAFLDAHA